MKEIIWNTVPKIDLSTFAAYDPSKLSKEEVFKLFQTIQVEFQEIRKRNIGLMRKLNKTFKHHPIKRRGVGWVYHRCGPECFRKKYWEGNSVMSHRFEYDPDN